MKAGEQLTLVSNPYKTLDMKSNLVISSFNKMSKSILATESIGMRYNRAYLNITSTFDQYIQMANKAQNFQNNYYENIIKPYSKMLDLAKIDYTNNIDKLRKSLELIAKNPLLESISTTVETWQSSIESMSKSFYSNYNIIVNGAMKNIILKFAKMNQNTIDFSSLKAFNIDELIPRLPDIVAIEFNKELENKVNLQEVDAIVNEKIEDLKLDTQKQNANIVFAINELINIVEENSSKGSLIQNITNGVLTHVIILLITFVFNSINPYTPSNADIKYTTKIAKQVVETINIDNNFYNEIRIVVKDGLKVRQSNKMKSRVKYYLDFGSLVKLEYKNKNWSKISYTNIYTDEREFGWVLTRYIKKLD